MLSPTMTMLTSLLVEAMPQLKRRKKLFNNLRKLRRKFKLSQKLKLRLRNKKKSRNQLWKKKLRNQLWKKKSRNLQLKNKLNLRRKKNPLSNRLRWKLSLKRLFNNNSQLLRRKHLPRVRNKHNKFQWRMILCLNYLKKRRRFKLIRRSKMIKLIH